MAEQKGATTALDIEDFENDLIDVHKLLGEADDENWLVSAGVPTDSPLSFGFCPDKSDHIVQQSKKSLVNKLDNIARGGSAMAPYLSPISTMSSGSRSSNLSPGMSTYLRQNLSSTPLASNKGPPLNRFDPRTFTRPKLSIDSVLNDPNEISGNHQNLTDISFVDHSTPRQQLPTTASPIKQLNMTFDRRHSSSTPPKLNTTFEKFEKHPNPTFDKQLNATFDKQINATFDKQINATFDKQINATFDRQQLNATFDKQLNATFGLREDSPSHIVKNRTFDLESPGSAATFTRRKLSEGTSSNRRFSRDMSHDHLDEDRLSSTSESSASHRLNDVGDVQQLARMQEESLRQPIVTSHNHRSATISPSSEQSLHSPSTEGFSIGHNGQDYQSEEGSDLYRQHKQRSSGYQQYSSQDSLPDSPYSSQSLDSQSAQGQDRLRRSMPNLNKIRGRGGMSTTGAGRGAPAGTNGAGAPGLQRPSTYGLSRHHNSDPRLQAANGRSGSAGRGFYLSGRPGYAGPPSRGSMADQERINQSEHVSRNATFRAPQNQPKLSTGSRIARPAGSGIPRPGGSRLPGPTRSGIPKPSSSQPGSRASSVGPRRPAANDYYY